MNGSQIDSDFEELNLPDNLDPRAQKPRGPNYPYFKRRGPKKKKVVTSWRPEHEMLDAMVGEVTLDVGGMMAKRGLVNHAGPPAFRGKPSLVALQRGTGLSYQSCYRILHPAGGHHKVGINFDTLARICELLRCQPGDLLRYVPRGTALVVTTS